MSNILITPMFIEGNRYCFSPTTKMTPFVLGGDAVETAGGVMLYEDTTGGTGLSATAGPYSGTCKVGISPCASSVTIEIEGKIEQLNDDYDYLMIYLNGSKIYEKRALGTSSDPYATENIYATVTETLPERPCGHLLEAIASTSDDVANSYVFWFISVTVT